jgi:AcrR family transcriptional regulator
VAARARPCSEAPLPEPVREDNRPPKPEPAPRAPREGLTLERIVGTGIEIADTEGLETLSMRRVATELGVGTMSLYRYVTSKDALIELMVDRVHGEDKNLTPVPADWRSRLELSALREWRLYSRHPWVLQVIATPQPPLGPNVLADLERAMGALDGLGLDPVMMHWVTIAVSAQVQGAALLRVSEWEAERRTGVTTRQWRAAKMPMLSEILESGHFPMLSSLLERQEEVAHIDEWLWFSIRRLLDGVAVFIEERVNADSAGHEPDLRKAL